MTGAGVELADNPKGSYPGSGGDELHSMEGGVPDRVVQAHRDGEGEHGEGEHGEGGHGEGWHGEGWHGEGWHGEGEHGEGGHGGPEDSVEIAALKQRLKDQRVATLRAVHSAAELKTELSEAKAQVEKIRTYSAGQTRHAGAEKAAEISRLKGESERARAKLEREQKARKAEASRAAAKLSALEQQLSDYVVQASAANQSILNRRATMVQRVAISVVLLAIAIGYVFFWMGPRLRTGVKAEGVELGTADRTEDSVAGGHVSGQGAGQGAGQVLGQGAGSKLLVAGQRPGMVPPNTYATRGSSRGPQSEFLRAVDRLDYALAAFGAEKPEEVLWRVHQMHRGCAIAWNGGRPALLFGGEQGENALVRTLDECARAIEQLH